MGIPMNITAATAFITANKGSDIEIVLADGTSIFGTALSVNSKGVNVKDDGKTRSVSLSRVDNLVLVTDDTFGSDDDADDLAAADAEDTTDAEIYAMLSDGMSTAELAAILAETLNIDLDAKELRVHLRALGLGVGKGRKYSLTATEYRMVRDLVTAPATA